MRRAALLLGLALAACTTLPQSQVTTPDGVTAAFALAGERAPAIVLQAGLGDGKSVWAAVFERLATHGQVIAFDRPGYGASPAVAGPRDPCSVAAEQRELLRVVGVRPPYVLVGHSLGGLYQFAYAKLYPQDVAALVLLDPTHPQHWARMQRDAAGSAAVVKSLRAVAFGATMAREFDDQAACLDRLHLDRPPALPTRLLVRGRFELVERGAFETLVHGLEADWMRLTGAAHAERVEGAGHYIHKDRPEAVVDAVLQAARR